jgi:hypothetical protein
MPMPAIAWSGGKLLVAALTCWTSEAWGEGVAGADEEKREERLECTRRRQGDLPAAMGNMPAAIGKTGDARGGPEMGGRGRPGSAGWRPGSTRMAGERAVEAGKHANGRGARWQPGSTRRPGRVRWPGKCAGAGDRARPPTKKTGLSCRLEEQDMAVGGGWEQLHSSMNRDQDADTSQTYL